jgi:hypothetical protein
MTQTAIQLERRRINDDIETAYLDTIHAETDMVVAISTGIGSYYRIYRAFYSSFALLIALTDEIDEMRKNEAKLCAEARRWREQNIQSNMQDAVMKETCRAGSELFTRYKKALMDRGVISLPTRRG